MINALKAEAVQPPRAGQPSEVRPSYLEALTLVERLHRRLLDVIKDEFDRRGRSDVNSVQALLLYNIGGKELTAGELRTPAITSARMFHITSKSSSKLAFCITPARASTAARCGSA
jgi:hypothetical protein